MTEEQGTHTKSEQESVYALIHRIVSIFVVIVYTTLFVTLGIVVILLYSVVAVRSDSMLDSREISMAILGQIWEKFFPFTNLILTTGATVLVLVVVFVSVKWLLTSSSSLFDLSRVVSDLPSVLALIVIITISLLPLLRIDIPSVLSNIALVIVGFYFGKATKETKSDSESTTIERE